MKHLIALLVLVSGFAHAAEIKVFEAPSGPWAQIIDGNFAVNKTMGRAWVEVEISERARGPHRDTARSFSKAKVEGLTYDMETSKIMLDLNGQSVECAYVTNRRFFSTIKETGCSLVPRKEKRIFDDGYRTYKVEYLQLFLVTK